MPTQHAAMACPIAPRSFVAYAFAVVVAAGYLLPQDREHSFVLNMFWAWWWPGIFIVYPFLGRVWCASECAAGAAGCSRLRAAGCWTGSRPSAAAAAAAALFSPAVSAPCWSSR